MGRIAWQPADRGPRCTACQMPWPVWSVCRSDKPAKVKSCLFLSNGTLFRVFIGVLGFSWPPMHSDRVDVPGVSGCRTFPLQGDAGFTCACCSAHAAHACSSVHMAGVLVPVQDSNTCAKTIFKTINLLQPHHRLDSGGFALWCGAEHHHQPMCRVVGTIHG